jgi:hypothetical protein
LKRTILNAAAALALSVVMVSPALAQSSTGDTHAQAARQLLAYLNTEARMNLAVQQIVALQIERDPRLGRYKPQLQSYVGKYLAWEQLLPDIIKEYKKVFTEVQIREIFAFYNSETGRKALGNMDRIIREVGKSRNELMQQNAMELRTAIEAEQRRQGGLRPAPVVETPKQ